MHALNNQKQVALQTLLNLWTELSAHRAGTSRSMTTRLNSRALTAELGRARTLTELLSLYQRHGNRFDRCNLGAFWSKFKNLPRGEFRELRNRLAPVCERTVRMLPALDARKVANVAHAFAKSGLVGTGPCQNVYIYIYI